MLLLSGWRERRVGLRYGEALSRATLTYAAEEIRPHRRQIGSWWPGATLASRVC